MVNQQLYAEIQMLAQQAKQVKGHLENIDSQIEDLKRTHISLKEFGELKEDSIMLSQISNGIFVKSELKDTKNVVLNVGAEVGVDKTVQEAQSLVEKQLKDTNEVRDHFISQFNSLKRRIEEIQNQLEKKDSVKN